jgi:hypothetical protein
MTTPESIQTPEPTPPLADSVQAPPASPVRSTNRYLQMPVLVGAGLILLGLVYMVDLIFNLPFGRAVWPFFIIIPGGLILRWSLESSSNDLEPFVAIGSLITSTGLLLLYQSISGHWVSWAYAWALIAPGSVGFAFWLYGKRKGKEGLAKSGSVLMTIAAAMFFIGAVFFELVLNISHFGRLFGAVLLLVAGGYFLVRSFMKK